MSIPISLGIFIGIDKNNEIKNFKETIVQYNIYNDYLKNINEITESFNIYKNISNFIINNKIDNLFLYMGNTLLFQTIQIGKQVGISLNKNTIKDDKKYENLILEKVEPSDFNLFD